MTKVLSENDKDEIRVNIVASVEQEIIVEKIVSRREQTTTTMNLFNI